MRTLTVALLLVALAAPTLDAQQRRERRERRPGPAGLAQPAKPASAAQPMRPRGALPPQDKSALERLTPPPATPGTTP